MNEMIKSPEEFWKEVGISPPIKEDTLLRLTYKEIYLRIRKLIENGEIKNKEIQLEKLDKIFKEAAEKINLL